MRKTLFTSASAQGFILLAALLPFAAAHATGSLYKWTDANGVVQYSDQPHEGAQTLSLNSRPQIRILTATYGANVDPAGSRDNATGFFRQKCDGHADCTTGFDVASVTAHGDPYFGHDKTLDVVYACVMASGIAGPAITVHIGERAERRAPQQLTCTSNGQPPQSDASGEKVGSTDNSPYGRSVRQLRKSVGAFTELEHCRFQMGRMTLYAGSLKSSTIMTNVSIAGVAQPTEVRAACTGDVRCMQYTRPDGTVSNENQLMFETTDDGVAANRAFAHLIRLCGGSSGIQASP